MHKSIKAIIAALYFCLNAQGIPAYAESPELGSKACSSVIMVSSWTKNNVKIFDGCSGDYIKDLDNQGLIDGPLGILEAPDGDILVISENNGRLLKFDRTTLSIGKVVMGDNPDTQAIENNFISKPSGAVIDKDGTMYASSYGDNSIVKINTHSWTIMDTILPQNNTQIKGIDAGMALSMEGELYLPGYDSDNIIRLNLKTKKAHTIVTEKDGGLDAPRTILLKGNEIIVTAERSNAIKVFDKDTGKFKSNLIDISRPTGLIKDGDNHFLVSTANAVFRVSNDGKTHDKIIKNGAGGLDAATFIYRLEKVNDKS